MNILRNTITIPIGDMTESGFILKEEKVFTITYLKSINNKPNVRVVVNGVITKEIINFANCHEKYKNKLLSAIKWYVYRDLEKDQISKHPITLSKIMQQYYEHSPNIINNLLPINKIADRDLLTEFNLIKI